MTRSARVASLLVTATVALAGSTLPASAAPPKGERAQHCVEPGAARTDASAARTARGGRAGDHKVVTARQQAAIAARTRRLLADRTQSTTRGRATQRLGPGTIPVFVHVMAAKGGAGNVSKARIRDQVRVLNAAFGGSEAPGVAADTGFRFQLAGVDRYTNAAWHRDRKSSSYRAQTRRGQAGALNVWLVGSRDLGVATFPWDYASRPKLDGVRVHYKTLPGGGIRNFDQGKTLVHEVGHWLGLYHTFQGRCSDLNDEVGDTAPQGAPSQGCPSGRDTCPLPGTDPVHNYMDYSHDSCFSQFTPGQAQRMQQMALVYR